MMKLTSWPRMTPDNESYVNACAKCNELRLRVDKSIGTWPKLAPWERLHMDWAQKEQVGNVLIIVDAGSGCVEAFVCGDRPTEKIIKCLSSAFARFRVPHSLVSDNTKEFTLKNGKSTHWLEIQGCKKVESPQYALPSNGLPCRKSCTNSEEGREALET